MAIRDQQGTGDEGVCPQKAPPTHVRPEPPTSQNGELEHNLPPALFEKVVEALVGLLVADWQRDTGTSDDGLANSPGGTHQNDNAA
jgi:hypothetical protein